MKKASVIIIGGGGRGTIYARHLRELADRAEVAGIAEPRDFFRNRIASMHNIPRENICSDWRELAARPKFADAVVITAVNVTLTGLTDNGIVMQGTVRN